MSSTNNKSLVNDSVIAIDDTPCLDNTEEESNSSSRNQNTDNATNNNFQLYLSDTISTREIVSLSSEAEATNIKNKPNYENIREKNLNEFNQKFPAVESFVKPQDHYQSITSRKEEVEPKKKASKKRISICGDGLTENVLNIDDTVIDQFDNELDHKSGKLFTLSDTALGEELRVSNMLSSTKMSNDCSSLSKKSNSIISNTGKSSKSNPPPVNLRVIKESSSDDDQYERCK
jgi:hypothetical protein